MNVRAVLMAGGRSSRMRAGGFATHKALLPIAGITMIERNLAQLLGAGVRDIAVVVGEAETELRHFAEGRLVAVARDAGAAIDVCVETTPLGNIGFVARINGDGDVLVVYADNLTLLDMRELLAVHRANGHDVTFAVHEEPVALAYGLLDIDASNRVLRYREKPQLRFPVSSGTCVVGARARRSMQPGRPCDARTLFDLIDATGGSVGAYRHAAPWVDVNDPEAAARAEALVRARPDAFGALAERLA